MNEVQMQSLLQSIALSSGIIIPGKVVTQQDRINAFTILDQFKSYKKKNDLDRASSVVAQSLNLLSLDQHSIPSADGTTAVDVTTPTKLYVLGCISDFVKTPYYTKYVNDVDRVALRTAVLACAKQLIHASRQITATPELQQQDLSRGGAAQRKILGSKLAGLLSELVVRDFPQRWTSFAQDVLLPFDYSGRGGGLWNDKDDREGLGTRMCLECFSLVVEDCTDSDFNAQISTHRRNDVLTGLNEIVSQVLTPISALLMDQFNIIKDSKKTLLEMESYLVSNGRGLDSMTAEERTEYTAENHKKEQAGSLLSSCLSTMEHFCTAMPLEWATKPQAYMGNDDFISAFMFLLREGTASVQVSAVACLEAVSLRKIEFQVWFRLVCTLPAAIGDAHNLMAETESNLRALGHCRTDMDLLVEELPYHRAISRMLAQLLSAHVSHVTTTKDFMDKGGAKFQSLSTYLGVLSEFLSHPSGRVCSEQINTWIALLRDPQVAKTEVLSPHLSKLLDAYMKHLVKLRWNDVEEEVHPMFSIIRASWDEKEEYESWLNDLRSKTSQLFRFVAQLDSQLCASTISTSLQNLIMRHGNGEPRSHVDPKTNRLSQQSEAIVQFDGIQQPLDNILQSLPPSCVEEDGAATFGRYNRTQTATIRASIRDSLSQLANAVVSWAPSDVWLRFTHASLLRSLKHVWKYNPSTLPTGVDILLTYLTAQDEWANDSKNEEGNLSGEVVGLRKKSGLCLISVSKEVPHLLVPWIGQLSDRARNLLSSDSILSSSRMHLYEFLSCVATAVNDPTARSNFVADVLSNALEALISPYTIETLSSVESLMKSLGILEAANNPASVTNPAHVQEVTQKYARMFSAFNQLLSVGKRCHEAAKKRPNGGIPMFHTQPQQPQAQESTLATQNFPDEGPVSLVDLSYDDPFVPLWPKLLPPLLRLLNVTLGLWHPKYQAVLLRNPVQRYVYAISDDEVYLSKKLDNSGNGGVFGKGGTAGSVVSGWSRRDMNLVPRWSGWFNELRNVSFQLLGLLANQRVIYAPELAEMYPEFLRIVADPKHLRAMEHRHMTQFMKQFVEQLLMSCPSTLYQIHLAPLLAPVLDHFQTRLQLSWAPIVRPTPGAGSTSAALTLATCDAAASFAEREDENWFASYYGRAGVFVGDLDNVTGEAAVEKARVDLTRAFSDVVQAALALKGEWALVLANQAKEEQAMKKNDPSKLTSGPKTGPQYNSGQRVNADGTPRTSRQIALEARQHLRINGLCHFLLLEDERIASSVVLGSVQCLSYPDAYTCRRCVRICHRILETVAWEEHYTSVLAQQMFSAAVKNIVTEPKWMVGIEWDMIALVRDIYCRLVLGQTLLTGGQGAAMQQPMGANGKFEQSKNVDKPLQGGGVLLAPSTLPQQLLANLPGIGVETVSELNVKLKQQLSAKDQRDKFRDFLHTAAENLKELEGGTNGENGIFGRAVSEESVLNQKARAAALPNIPEKLVTQSQVVKQASKDAQATEDILNSGQTLGALYGKPS